MGSMVHACMYACIRVCAHDRMHTFMQPCMHVCMQPHMYVRESVSACVLVCVNATARADGVSARALIVVFAFRHLHVRLLSYLGQQRRTRVRTHAANF